MKAGKRTESKNNDSLQIAAALSADCDAILTNDMDMKEIKDIEIVILADVIKK